MHFNLFYLFHSIVLFHSGRFIISRLQVFFNQNNLLKIPFGCPKIVKRLVTTDKLPSGKEDHLTKIHSYTIKNKCPSLCQPTNLCTCRSFITLHLFKLSWFSVTKIFTSKLLLNFAEIIYFDGV
jgi:hypothetical protein